MILNEACCRRRSSTRAMTKASEAPETGGAERILIGYRVSGSIGVWRFGSVDEGVSVNELPDLRTVIPIDEIAQPSGVNVGTRKAERRVARESAGGFGVAPGVVGGGCGDGAGGSVDDCADGADRPPGFGPFLLRVQSARTE